MMQNQFTVGLGLRLKRARKEAGKSRLDFATACGVTPGNIAHWENGRGSPSALQLAKIAELINCDLNNLILGTEKVIIDITDMWPGNVIAIQNTIKVIQLHEQTRDRQWPAYWERYRHHQGDTPPNPPWYDELR